MPRVKATLLRRRFAALTRAMRSRKSGHLSERRQKADSAHTSRDYGRDERRACGVVVFGEPLSPRRVVVASCRPDPREAGDHSLESSHDIDGYDKAQRG